MLGTLILHAMGMRTCNLKDDEVFGTVQGRRLLGVISPIQGSSKYFHKSEEWLPIESEWGGD